jgi:hypothetical protein
MPCGVPDGLKLSVYRPEIVRVVVGWSGPGRLFMKGFYISRLRVHLEVARLAEIRVR